MKRVGQSLARSQSVLYLAKHVTECPVKDLHYIPDVFIGSPTETLSFRSRSSRISNYLFLVLRVSHP